MTADDPRPAREAHNHFTREWVTCADLLSPCTHDGPHVPVGLDGLPADVASKPASDLEPAPDDATRLAGSAASQADGGLRARVEKLARQYKRLGEDLHSVPAAEAFHDAALDLRRALDGDA